MSFITITLDDWLVMEVCLERGKTIFPAGIISFSTIFLLNYICLKLEPPKVSSCVLLGI